MEFKSRKPRTSSPDKLEEKPKKKGLWHMELTEENYYAVKEELDYLRK